MVTLAPKPCRVADLMDRHAIDLDQLVESTGMDVDVAEAIAHQRYTPSLAQRDCVSGVFRLRREHIMWGHSTPVEPHIHAPI